MNIIFKTINGQVQCVAVIALLLVLGSCSGKKSESYVLPPITSPLMRSVIGYGVINVSYTQLKIEPAIESTSHGYLRHGSVVRVLERRIVNKGNQIEIWVLAEGLYQGWLREEIVDIYDNELQAQTAAETLIQ